MNIARLHLDQSVTKTAFDAAKMLAYASSSNETSERLQERIGKRFRYLALWQSDTKTFI